MVGRDLAEKGGSGFRHSLFQFPGSSERAQTKPQSLTQPFVNQQLTK